MLIIENGTSPTIKLGPFLDDTDGKTAETGLTIAQADVRLSKNGGDFAQKNSATSATHDESGWYDVPLNATDTGTNGRLQIAVAKSGALPVWAEVLVVPANVYNALCAETGQIRANIVQYGGSAGTFSGGRPEVNTSHIAGSAVSTTAAQIGVNVVQVSGDGAAADNLEAACDGTTYNIGGGAVVAASVTGAVGSVTGAVGSVTGNVGGNVTGSVGSVATDGITAASIATGAIDADAVATDAIAEIADGVWDEARSGHNTAGSFGEGVASVQGNVTGSVASVTGNVGGNVTGSVSSVTGAVGSVTGNVGGNVTGSVGSVTGAVGSVTGNVGGNVTGSVGSVATGGITAASIATGAIDADALAADAVDEIWSKAMTELASVPGVTGTVLQAVQWLFLLSRNKITQTNTTQTLRNDADSANIATAGVTDDGSTFTRAEFTSS